MKSHLKSALAMLFAAIFCFSLLPSCSAVFGDLTDTDTGDAAKTDSRAVASAGDTLSTDELNRIGSLTLDTAVSTATTDESSDTQQTDSETKPTEKVIDTGISTDTTWEKTQELDPKACEAPKLSINGIPCAYDQRSNTFLYAVSQSAVGKTQVFTFESSMGAGTCALLIQGNPINPKTGKYIPTENQTMQLRFYSRLNRFDCQLRISIIPVVTISTETGADVTKRDDQFCTVTLQDPDYKANGGEAYFTSYAAIHARGASSFNYIKKPYKIELQKYVTKGSSTVVEERNASLLGMRKDDDWTMDALYLDQTLIHNKISYDLWLEMGGDTAPYGIAPGPRCAYCEVILNGKYHGLYMLVEPVDEKQTGVEKKENTPDTSHGMLIKTTGWDYTRFDTYKGAPSVGKETWGGFEMKYPTGSAITSKDWKPIIDLMTATVNGSDAQFKSTVEQYLSRDNVVNYWIFLSVTLARDNAGKNIIYSVPNSSKLNYKMYINVWDVDNAFGYRYGSPHQAKDSATKPAAEYSIEWFELLRRYLAVNASGSQAYLESRWTELTKKGGLCSAEALKARVDKEFDFLKVSGAWDREDERWPESVIATIEEERTYTNQWIDERVPVVDSLIFGKKYMSKKV